MLPAVSEMLGCPARRMALPLLLPAALAVLAGKEKAIEAVMELQERPGTVMAGDSHGRVWRAHGGAAGVGWRCEGRPVGSE